MTSRRARSQRGGSLIRRKLNRPSLKITRQVDQREVSAFNVEEWNPFTGFY
jgi:hypothetical protein